MSRVKAAATRAPQTLEAATAVAVRFAAADAEIALIETARAEAKAKADAEADAALVPLLAERKDLSKQLSVWFEANVDALTQGKRKSIELGGCTLGYRLTPPKVTFAHGKDEDAVGVLSGQPLWDTLVRVRLSLDKPAVLRALDREEHAAVLTALGFSAQQKEEFFVDRAGGATIADTQ